MEQRQSQKSDSSMPISLELHGKILYLIIIGLYHYASLACKYVAQPPILKAKTYSAAT